MRFEPVFLPPNRALDGRLSQTFLRHFDRCPRSGYLYALFKGEASTVEMVRGRALHEILQRCVDACVQTGEVTIPGELAKAEVDAVLSEQHVPFDQHDYVRESVWRWAEEWALDPSKVIASERLIVLDVEGFQVRMRIDYAERIENDAAVRVVDWKSGLGMPTQEEVARKRTTPLAGGGAAAALMAKSFQLVLYALGLRYGQPVREERCAVCAADFGRAGDEVCTDPDCNGRGYREIVEPFPLADRAQRFDCAYVFPGIEDKQTGRMARREVTLTPMELDAYLVSLRGLVRRVRESEESGDWPAQTSDAACGECPAKLLCPIPAELRDHAGRINTDEEAAEAMEQLDREKAVHASRMREIKAHVKHGGRVRFGLDRVAELVPTSSEEIVDKDALWLAIERTVLYGEPFEKADHVREKKGTSFRVRTLTADELAAEAAEGGSDGDDGDERSADERWGEHAPW